MWRGFVQLDTSRVCLLAVLLSLAVSLAGCRPATDTVLVIDVIDGDTITIEGGQRVRYIGIDTPETGPPAEPFAIEAWQANRALVEGRRVRLERDVSEVDRYGRLLRYVYVDGIFVNEELVSRGLARAKAYPPDTRHQDQLKRAEAAARGAGLGIWAR